MSDHLWVDAKTARTICGFSEKKFRSLVRAGFFPPSTYKVDPDNPRKRWFSRPALEAHARNEVAA